jgi:hypothetical protein
MANKVPRKAAPQKKQPKKQQKPSPVKAVVAEVTELVVVPSQVATHEAPKPLKVKVNPVAGLLRNMSQASVADETLNLNVSVDTGRLIYFIWEMISPVLRAKRDSAMVNDMLAAALFMATNIKNYPLVGLYPPWYMELCYSAKDKTVNGQGFVISVPGPASDWNKDRLYGRVPGDNGANNDFIISQIITSVPTVTFNLPQLQDFLSNNASDLGCVDVTGWKPRNKNCVSIAAFPYIGEAATPTYTVRNVGLEVPITTKWIAALALTGGTRTVKYHLANVPMPAGTIAYLVRNKMENWVSKVMVKDFDPRFMIQRFYDMITQIPNITATQTRTALKYWYSAFMYKIGPFLGIGNDSDNLCRVFVDASTNVYPLPTAQFTLPPPVAGSYLLPSALFSLLSCATPTVIEGKLYLPRFIDSLNTCTGFPALKFGPFVQGSGWASYGNWDAQQTSDGGVQALFPNSFKVSTIDRMEWRENQKAMSCTYLWTSFTNQSTNKLFSKTKITDVVAFRINHWLPEISGYSGGNLNIGTMYDEINCYSPGYGFNTDFYANSFKFAVSHAANNSTAVNNLPHDTYDQKEVRRIHAQLKELIPIANSIVPSPYPTWKKIAYKTVPRYGNYGGPNYSGGKEGGSDYSIDGIDVFDEYYRLHDVMVHIAQGDATKVKHADDVLHGNIKQHPGADKQAYTVLSQKVFNPIVSEDKDEL